MRPATRVLPLFSVLAASALLVVSCSSPRSAGGAGEPAADSTRVASASSAPTPTPDDKQTSTIEASAAPTEKITGPEAPIYTVSELEIPASATPKEAAKAYVNALSKWNTAGMTAENANKGADVEIINNYNSEAYANDIASQYSDIFANALYTKGWESSELISPIIERSKKVNAESIVLFLATDTEEHPFKRDIKVDKVTVLGQTDVSIQMLINATEHNNSDENRVGSELAPQLLDYTDSKFTMNVTMTLQNNTYKVVSDLRQ